MKLFSLFITYIKNHFPKRRHKITIKIEKSEFGVIRSLISFYFKEPNLTITKNLKTFSHRYKKSCR